jgi:hypothetical protein
MPTAAAPDEPRDEYSVPVVLNERRVLFEPVVDLLKVRAGARRVTCAKSDHRYFSSP